MFAESARGLPSSPECSVDKGLDARDSKEGEEIATRVQGPGPKANAGWKEGDL